MKKRDTSNYYYSPILRRTHGNLTLAMRDVPSKKHIIIILPHNRILDMPLLIPGMIPILTASSYNELY